MADPRGKETKHSRTGLGGFPPFIGVDTNHDAGGGDNRYFVDLINLRRTKVGTFLGRQGQRRHIIAGIPSGAEVQGIFDASDQGAVFDPGASSLRLFQGAFIPTPWWLDPIITGQDEDDRNGEGKRMNYDPNQDPKGYAFNKDIWLGANALFNGSRLYVVKTHFVAGLGWHGYKLAQVKSWEDETDVWPDGTSGTLLNGQFQIADVCVSSNVMYIAVVNLATDNLEVWTWTGYPAVPTRPAANIFAIGMDDEFTHKYVQLYPFNGKVVLIYKDNTTGNYVVKRLNTDNTWTTLTYPSSARAALAGGVGYGTKFYIGANEYVLSVPQVGTAMTEETSVTGGSTVARFGAMTTFGGNLFYSYVDKFPPDRRQYIGKFDGATWANTHFDVENIAAATNQPDGIFSWFQIGADLYAVVYSRTQDDDFAFRTIIKSNGATTTSWSIMYSEQKNEGIGPGGGTQTALRQHPVVTSIESTVFTDPS